MKSKTVDDFWELYEKLPEEIRERAEKAYDLWLENHSHPSLQFKKLQGYKDLYSVRINQSYRVVGKLKEDTIYWFWIGSHADFDDIFG
jgi:mRNA-degrading endonuclease RelE of RelBE toxin-antitoxin system